MNSEPRTIKVMQTLTANNDVVAAQNRTRFDDNNVLAVNLIASPGAGKTSLILSTIQTLNGAKSVGVIEGDVAGNIDAKKVLEGGAQQAVQINTGGNCHLEADMVRQALPDLALEHVDLMFIENVGNLICPNHWNLGEHLKVCLASVAEGDDKPLKYPEIFASSDAVVLNKIDLIDFVEFDRDFFYRHLTALNPKAPVFELSCRTKVGITAWVNWLIQQRN